MKAAIGVISIGTFLLCLGQTCVPMAQDTDDGYGWGYGDDLSYCDAPAISSLTVSPNTTLAVNQTATIGVAYESCDPSFTGFGWSELNDQIGTHFGALAPNGQNPRVQTLWFDRAGTFTIVCNVSNSHGTSRRTVRFTVIDDAGGWTDDGGVGGAGDDETDCCKYGEWVCTLSTSDGECIAGCHCGYSNCPGKPVCE